MNRSASRRELLLVTNNAGRVFQRSIITGASEVGEERGYRIEVLEVPDRTDAERVLPELERATAGLLLIADVLPDEAVARLHDQGIPITLVSHGIAGVEVPSIVHDNAQGMSLLTEEAFDRAGRCNGPVYVRGSRRQRDSREREAAFRRELMRRGLAIDEDRFLDGEFEPEAAASALEEYLAAAPPPDSLLAADFLMAIACQEVLRRSGIAVPGETVVLGFGDGPEAEEAGLTTVSADVLELGRRAARQLVGQAEGLQVLGLTLLSTTLRRRTSSG